MAGRASVVNGQPVLHIGRDDFSRSLVRALDIGGLVWEGDTTYPSLDGTLQAREDALARVLREQFGEDMYAT